MRAEMRVLLQTAGQIQVFNQAYPVSDPGVKPVIGTLDEHVATASVLVGQQAKSAARSTAANRTRRHVRERLWEGLLRLFAEFITIAGDEIPELRGFKAPRRRAADLTFVTQATAIIEASRAHLDVLGKHGLTAALVDEAAQLLAEFQNVSKEAKDAYQGRVEASKALMKEHSALLAAITRLDRLNRHRFADQPAVLARWETARNVVGPAVKAKDDGTPDTPPSGTGGDVAAAV